MCYELTAAPIALHYYWEGGRKIRNDVDAGKNPGGGRGEVVLALISHYTTLAIY